MKTLEYRKIDAFTSDNSLGNPAACVYLNNEQTLTEDEINIFPNEKVLKEFSLNNGIDVILIFCKDVKNKNHYIHTRVFAAKYGYLEDPATGSANSSFGYYLLKNNIWNGNPITLEQGGIDRVFNTVNLSYKDNRILFGGKATTRINGLYYI